MKKIYLALMLMFAVGQLSAQSFSTSSNVNSSTHETVKNDKGEIVKVRTIKDLSAFTDIVAEIENLNNAKASSARIDVTAVDQKLSDAYARYKDLLKAELKKKGLSKEDKDIIESELDNINNQNKK